MGKIHFCVQEKEQPYYIIEETGSDVNAQKNDSLTALIRTVKALLKKGEDVQEKKQPYYIIEETSSDVNAQKNDGLTALTRTVISLLEKGEDVNVQDSHGDTLLILAVRCGHTETAKVLLEKRADIYYLQKYRFKCSTEIVKALLEKGADVNVQDSHGDTPLMLAARYGHTETTKVLLESGADINIQNSYGYTALMLATFKCSTEIAKVLLESGADINIQNSYGYTALMLVTPKRGSTEIVKALLEKGADVNVQDKNGDTPLMLAARYGHTETAKVLLESGADIDVQNTYGHTALMLVTSKRGTEIVKALLEKGADIDLQDKNGSTSLDRFILNGWKEIIVRVLINQDSLETYRDPRSKYGKELLIQETLKLIDDKKKSLDKKSFFVRLFSENVSLKISSYLRMIDIIKLSQVSKKSKPIWFSSQQIGDALSSFSFLPDEEKRKKTTGKA